MHPAERCCEGNRRRRRSAIPCRRSSLSSAMADGSSWLFRTRAYGPSAAVYRRRCSGWRSTLVEVVSAPDGRAVAAVKTILRPYAERESNYPFGMERILEGVDCVERFGPLMRKFATYLLSPSITAIQPGCVVTGLADSSLPRPGDHVAKPGLPRRINNVAKAGVG